MQVFHPKLFTFWTGKICHSLSDAGLAAAEVQKVFCREEPRAAVLT
jgi:hypothetical protein